jgi:anti-sigma28 factor (negative regulator of flagellin synthesis)
MTEVSDKTARRLRPETFSQRMARIRSEKMTPAERAEVAAKKEQRAREQRIERLKLEIEAGKAASDKFYEP